MPALKEELAEIERQTAHIRATRLAMASELASLPPLTERSAVTFGVPRIRTDFVYPPIPIRNLDWQAVYDDDEPEEEGRMAVGFGATEAEAIADLIENHPRSARR